MTRSRGDMFARNGNMLSGIGRFIEAQGMATELFRAHIDVYVRMLRADFGRVGAALKMNRRMVAAITKGVDFGCLPAKQKLYYLALRTLPMLSIMLP